MSGKAGMQEVHDSSVIYVQANLKRCCKCWTLQVSAGLWAQMWQPGNMMRLWLMQDRKPSKMSSLSSLRI